MALLNLTGLITIGVPLYFLLLALYRLTLHPLAKYPGPLTQKISGWPNARAAKSGKRHLILQQLHLTYGPVVRIGPNLLSFNTSQAFHDITTKRDANVDKSGFIRFSRAISDAWHLQQLRDKHEHSQRRRIMGHAFTDSALKSAEDFMLDQTRTWTALLTKGSNKSADGWSETKDMGLWTNLLTLDVLGELCFGKSFGAMDAGDHDFIHLGEGGAKLAYTMSYSPLGPLLIPILRTQKLLKLLSPKMYTARWALRHNLAVLVADRQKLEQTTDKDSLEKSTRKDFFHHVLRARDDSGATLPLAVYTAEALLLTVAGTDTTSTALSSTLFYLLRNPAKLTKLRAELANAFQTVEDIRTGPQLSSCNYLRACADEGMRMHPPVPGPLTRRTLTGGATVDGIHIPADIDVEVPIYVLAHNQAYFPEPSSYIPERWIAGSKTSTFEVTDDLVAKQRGAFVPFSTGPRSCLGIRMAYMEMSIVLARLVFTFDMRFDEARQPPTTDFEALDCFISLKDGPYLQFKLRDGVHT